jgi:hypothetical protein
MSTSENRTVAKATASATTFRRATAITTTIRASPAKVWSVLTNAADFPRWNPTVTKLDGTIGRGERLALEVPTAPGRTFKPRVTAFEPGKRMVWSDGQAPFFAGVRTFTLDALGDGSTRFTMDEEIRGLMLPLAAKSLPDFAPVFEQYAAALKREAEDA